VYLNKGFPKTYRQKYMLLTPRHIWFDSKIRCFMKKERNIRYLFR